MGRDLKSVIDAFNENNFDAHLVKTERDALSLALSFIKKGEVVSSGGSITLKQCGIIEELQRLNDSGELVYLDRSRAVSSDENKKIMQSALDCDVYFLSSNALIADGRLYNVDGFGNRVGALTYGPKSIVVVAGMNKIVDDLDGAIDRVRRIAAPKNCVRLKKETYCAAIGHCIACDRELDGCDSPDRICRHYQLTSRQRQKGRIKLILVEQELGF